MRDQVLNAVAAYLGQEVPSLSPMVPPRVLEMLQASSIYQPGLLSGYDFDFALPAGKKEEHILAAMLRWMSQWDRPNKAGVVRPWVVLYGAHGVGKTRLARMAATLFMIREWKPATEVCWSTFLKEQHGRIEASKNGRRARGTDLSSLFTVPCLIIDDISTGQIGASVWAMDMLFSLLQARTGRLTFFTSNVCLADTYTADGKMSPSQYRRGLLAAKAATGPEAETFRDLVNKVCDRFGGGRGSSVAGHLIVKSINEGSYRQ